MRSRFGWLIASFVLAASFALSDGVVGAAPDSPAHGGRTAKERLPVRYVPSPIKPGERVWRVDLQ